METLKALAPLGIPVAVICACVVLLVIVGAVVFGGLELEAGSGKLFTLKVSKRRKEIAAHGNVPHVEAASEPASVNVETLPALTHDPVPQELTETEGEGEGGEDPDTVWAYFSAKTLAELDASFEPFMQDLEPAAVEFWHTDYLRRRERLGADRAREAMRDLAAQHPTWAYPHALLVRWALADHDLVEAKRHLDAGLTKTQSPQFGYVLSAGVELLFKASGKQAALDFAIEWSVADLPESVRAGAFVTLADQLKTAGDTDGYRIALEFASVIQPTNPGRAFALAYSYAETNARWAPAVWHYQRCVGSEDDGPIARNNVGIIYSHIDKAVAIATYEQASADGDKFASANLAHLLIEDGYVAIAQGLLDEVQDPGRAAENHAAAKQAALAKRRQAEGMLENISDVANTDVEPYKASLAAALRALQNGEQDTTPGYFASADRKVIVQLDGQQALCQLRVGSGVVEGTLQNQTTCFAGWLSTKGGGLLTSDVGQFTLLNEGGGQLRLFRWPSSIGLANRVETFELHRTDSQPELAPPPPPPPPPVGASHLLTNALLGKL